jgi:hypothetical protein
MINIILLLAEKLVLLCALSARIIAVTLIIFGAPALSYGQLPNDVVSHYWKLACGGDFVGNRSCAPGGVTVDAGGYRILIDDPGSGVVYRARIRLLETVIQHGQLLVESEEGKELLNINDGPIYQTLEHRGALRAQTDSGIVKVDVDLVSVRNVNSEPYQVIGDHDYYALSLETRTVIKNLGGAVFGYIYHSLCDQDRCRREAGRDCSAAPCYSIHRCTALRIGKRLLVTAGHCAPNRPSAGAPLDQIVWFGQDGVKMSRSFVVEGSDQPSDLTDVRFIWTNREIEGSGRIYDMSVAATVLVGQAYVLQWQQTFKERTKSELNVSGGQLCKILKPCGKKGLRNASFWHRCDTDFGSSGAPVFDQHGSLAGLSVRRVLDDETIGPACSFYDPKKFNEAEPIDAVKKAYERFCAVQTTACAQ